HDGEEAERHPRGQQGEQIAPLRWLPPRLGPGERVDDLAEQDRFGELRSGERQVADPQHPAELALRPEQPQHADIEANEIHGAPCVGPPAYKVLYVRPVYPPSAISQPSDDM